MKFIKAITFLIITAATSHDHHYFHHHSHVANLLRSNATFFIKTNKFIQNMMDEMFNTLNLPKRFLAQAKTKLLLLMHYDLNNIMVKNFEVYDELKNIATVDSKTINNKQLDELIKEIFNDKQYNIYNDITEEKHEHVQETRTTVEPKPENIDSKEFKEIMSEFLNKINRLTVDDLFKGNESEKSYSTRRNLKVWKPPPNMKNDLTLYNNFTETRRIYKGKATRIYKFPFMASIHVYEQFTCAGNIIAKDLVLTAASCLQLHHNNRFFREIPRTTFVRLGSDWVSRLGETIPVLEVYFHPQYNPRTLHHNLAIIRLERILKFQKHRRTKIRRILLDKGDGKLAANTNEIVILGWGSKKANQLVKQFEKLSVSYLGIYPFQGCREIYSEEFVTDKHFCAGFMSQGGGACNRDVGGPGIVSGVLVGVVSFGPAVCGAKDAPTVFTRVGPYIDWIESIFEMNPIYIHRRTTTVAEPMHTTRRVYFTPKSTFFLPPAVDRSRGNFGLRHRTSRKKHIATTLSIDALKNYENLFKTEFQIDKSFGKKSLYLRTKAKNKPVVHKLTKDTTLEPFISINVDTDKQKETLQSAGKVEDNSDISEDNEKYVFMVKEKEMKDLDFASLDNQEDRQEYIDTLKEKQEIYDNANEKEVTGVKLDDFKYSVDRELIDRYDLLKDSS